MRSWILYAFLPCSVALCQQPAGKIEFEVASIKPAQPMPMGQMRIGMNADAGMLRYTNVSLKECIRVAYRVKDFQVQGPDWLGSTRFDIVAKLPDGSSKDQIPEMLQALLADRFKLALHRDTKEHAIYALVAAKGGPKLKPAEVAAGDGPAAIRKPEGRAAIQYPDRGVAAMPRNAMYMSMSPDGAHLKAPSATLATLADMLSRFTERPVVDMTGIQGQYDFDLVFSPETIRGMPGGMMRMPPPGGGESRPASEPAAEPAGSIYDSVKRYGLKLEPRKAPMEILTIDHIEKEPTEN